MRLKHLKTVVVLPFLLVCSCASQPITRHSVASFSSTALIFATAKETGDKFKETKGLEFKELSQPSDLEANNIIDPCKIFQTITGIGGAITDASAEVFHKLPLQKQKEFSPTQQQPCDAPHGSAYKNQFGRK